MTKFYSAKIQLPPEMVCHGFSQNVILTIYERGHYLAVMCLKHRGKHYHVPIGDVDADTNRAKALACKQDPYGEMEPVLLAFTQLSPHIRGLLEVTSDEPP